jgi:hypothetical protein
MERLVDGVASADTAFRDAKADAWGMTSEEWPWDPGTEAARRPLVAFDTVVDVDRLARWAAICAPDRLIAVTFMSAEYSKVGSNWIAAMRRLGLRNYLVIAGDGEIQGLLEAWSVPCIRAHLGHHVARPDYVNPAGFTLKGLAMTALKFPVVHTLLRQGFSVIMSDADAVWLSRPTAALLRADSDVACQRVVYFPKATVRRWGFAVCSGFTFFRGRRSVVEFVETCIDAHRRVQDDQVALNVALLAAGTRWARNLATDSVACGTQADVMAAFLREARSTFLGTTASPKFTVQALPHHEFWRHDFVDADPADMIVCHPNAAKSEGDKLRRFEELGVRFV